jgi:thioredoxin reductase/Pyruvate/2-oxoacid:ferredoxin oxidoreductase delta subunit
METLLENVIIYGLVFLLCAGVIFFYLRRDRRKSKEVEAKIAKARQDGVFEPVSLHPVVNPNNCIQTGACIAACPEKDILGIVNGKATTINASHCVGHGACFHACPTEAITLCIGTEKRGVDLPHVNHNFETNIPGIFIAGELGGMGLIKNAVEQGRQAVDNIAKTGRKHQGEGYDVIVIGAGPAGISAALNAKKHKLSCLVLEQDTLGGTVYTFPRAKIVMTSPMDLPLYGKLKLYETSKPQLLEIWEDVIRKHDIKILENARVNSVTGEDGHFRVQTESAGSFTSQFVVLAIGRRGTPRKLNIPGENLEKVAYRLLEPEIISGKDVLVVGGGDSAIESALMLAPQNRVTLSYRGEAFSRLKPKNRVKIDEAVANQQVDLRLNSRLTEIRTDDVLIEQGGTIGPLKNELVYIFAGGELPTDFLKKIGLEITRKFGEAVLKHK